jgi:membrane fusion protein, peptide pheromone/bacteriocin exporter
MKTIFPDAILHHTTEYYQNKISVRSQIIYISILLFILTVLLLTPFVYIDVSVQSRGIMQSAINRNEIYSPVSGRIESHKLLENKTVQKGEVLAIIRSENLDLEMSAIRERKAQVLEFISDLQKLTSITLEKYGIRNNQECQNKLYKAAYYEFLYNFSHYEAARQKATRDFERSSLLYETKTIAFVEYDDAELRFKQAESNLRMFFNQRMASWEQELAGLQKELLQLNNQYNLLIEKQDQYKVIANVSGTLLNVPQIQKGDFVQSNQKMGEISPDSSLIAISFISPADIGFIQTGQLVNLQIDAYNYNQWGLAQGKVIDVSKDLTLVSEKEAAYRVICSIDDLKLKLKNGAEGEIKKGMTFNCRFVVARRSLFQLLYDKVDNWINPTLKLAAV